MERFFFQLSLGLMVAAAAQSMAYADSFVQAVEVAAQIQKFYDQTKVVSANFHQTYVHQLYQKTDRSSGTVVFKKPGRMRWDYAKPNGKKIISNGTLLQIYEPGEREQPGQLIEQPVRQEQLPQAMSFLLGSGKILQDFNVTLLDSKKHGFENGYVLELLPKKANPHFVRLIFYVDATSARRGIVHRVLIVDADGNRNRFDFKDLKFNRAAAESVFNWKAPPGTRTLGPS